MAAAFTRLSLRSWVPLSSRTFARSSPFSQTSRPLPYSRRHYSEQTTHEEKPQQQEVKTPQKEGENQCEEKLKAKEAAVFDLTNRLRYLQADFINLQRNAAREKEQTRDFAITRFSSDLLEIVDVLSLALKSVPPSVLPSSQNGSTSTDNSNPSQKSPEVYLQDLCTGVELTHQLLLKTLFKYHVKPFDPTGDKFDPNLHEALYQAPIPNKEPGTVIDCQKIGYMIKDRVLRAAQVGVVQEVSP